MADSIDTTPDETSNLPSLDTLPKSEGLPAIDEEASAALDSILKEISTDSQDTEGTAETTPEPVAEEKPEEPKSETVTEPIAKQVKSEEPAAAEEPPKVEGDEFDRVQLPPYTKPKSAEAFAEVKAIARQRISALEKELSELREKAKQGEELLKNGLTPEQKAELEELRTFRLQMDVEADPAWKEFNSQIEQNDELIYRKLRDSGASEEQLTRIKELGGPNEVDWDSISDRLPSSVKRFIDAKLVENEDLEAKKTLSKENAKKNAADYLKSRESSFRSSVESEFKSIVPSMPWMKEKPVTGTDAEKAAAQAHNKLMAEINMNVQEAMSDDSPKMKALLVAGFAQFLKTRFEASALKAELDALKSNTQKELGALKTSLKEKEEFISKMKKASTSRIGGSAPSEPRAPAKSDLNISPEEHLDKLFAEVQNTR